MGQLRTIHDELEELGYRVLFVSPDRPEKVRSFAREKQLGYRILSDSELRAARAFGVAFRVDDKTFRKLKGHGLDIEDASGKAHHLLPVPSVFLINRKGVIEFQYVNPDYRVRIAPEVLLAAARAAR